MHCRSHVCHQCGIYEQPKASPGNVQRVYIPLYIPLYVGAPEWSRSPKRERFILRCGKQTPSGQQTLCPSGGRQVSAVLGDECD